jgi:uncharacterized protein YkwD
MVFSRALPHPPRRVPRRRALLLAPLLALALLVAPQPSSAAASIPHTAAGAQTYAQAMLRLLNKERAWHHLRPLTMNAKLIHSAHLHDKRMARANEMSHQLPGEAFFATRISRAHYRWIAAGENIGWNSRMSLAGLRELERMMFRERPPNDGHRLNILSRTFRNVGIDVYFDAAHHKMWFTQDFGRRA